MKSFLTNTLILLTGLITITSPVLVSAKQLETVAEETYNCGTLGCTDGGGLMVSFLFNLAPGYFNERAAIKQVDEMFKQGDEVQDLVGNVIKREEYLDFVKKFQKVGVKIDYENFELIINETKLNAGADLSPNQETFKKYLDNGVRDFSLRSSRFADPTANLEFLMPQDSNLNIKGITRTVGDGAGNYSVINF